MTPAKLRALLAKATPGEWTAQHHHEGGAGDRRSMVLAETKLYGHDVIGVFDDERVLSPEAMANAALIVAAVNALPAMLDLAEAALDLDGDARWMHEEPRAGVRCTICGCRRYVEGEADGHGKDCAWRKLDAALAKLEGK